MEPKFWEERWQTGNISFHQSRVHPYLRKHFSSKPPTRVLVPLCGKTLDLVWLRAQGHEVVGIELSSIACEAFFEENRIAFQRSSRGTATLYEGGGISLWCGDFFDIPDSVADGCGVIYDRAALVALPPLMRKDYAKKILGLWSNQMKQPSEILLISFDYGGAENAGPPFSVPEAEIRSLYGVKLKVEVLESENAESLSGKPPRLGDIEITENLYRLSSLS